MNGYFIKATQVTPSVYFNTGKGILDIRGKSCPENPLKFYNHLVDSIESYGKDGAKSLTVNFALEYFNTSSSKCIYLMFKKVNEIRTDRSMEVVINWYYEEDDEDMMEAGEDLCYYFNFEVNYHEIPEITILGEMKEVGEESSY